MSSKSGAGTGDYEYLRSAIIEKEHIESEYCVVAYTTISLRSRPSVLVIRSEVRRRCEGLSVAPLCAIEAEWPNATVVSWPAFLFQHYVRLERMVSEAAELGRLMMSVQP